MVEGNASVVSKKLFIKFSYLKEKNLTEEKESPAKNSEMGADISKLSIDDILIANETVNLEMYVFEYQRK